MKKAFWMLSGVTVFALALPGCQGASSVSISNSDPSFSGGAASICTVSFDLKGGTSASHGTAEHYFVTVETLAVEDFFFDCVKDGCDFKGWSYNDVKVFDEKGSQLANPEMEPRMTFVAIWEESEEYRLATKPFLSVDRLTVRYGLYPQKNVNDASIVAALSKLTTPESNGWYLYEGYYYAKTIAAPCDLGTKFDNGTEIVRGSEYWFRCEAIEWKVLRRNENGEYFVLSLALLDAHNFYRDDNNRTIDGKTIYPDNYEYSDIRAWLNEDFYESAFALGSSNVLTTAVDNSPSTTDTSSNPYTCETINDKAFLLSYKDYLEPGYGFSPRMRDWVTRFSAPTDWAKARNAKCNAWYWTRSPFSRVPLGVWCVDYAVGLSDYFVGYKNGPVRPAITVKIA
ncbi:MAG: DUF6273 domain-containing protein [Bacilli bacterium]|nr:DUF6273 domain-containing protein [Bacilli bacterium]